jgi:chemotaxis protein MotA
MDPATLIGLAVAFGALGVSLVLDGASPMSLVLPSPMLLVFGGTIGVGIAGGLLRDAKGVVLSVKKALLGKPPQPEQTIATVISLAERARRVGVLAVVAAAAFDVDPSLAEGLRSAIDGTDPEDLRGILLDKIDSKRTSDRAAAKIFTDMGGYAPTIGIIGTVMHLVKVLENLSDPGSLGPSIAAAFVATLWGVLSANLMWLPIGARLKRLSDVECSAMTLAVEGILSIQAGANPRLVAERLQSLVPPEGAATKEAA